MLPIENFGVVVPGRLCACGMLDDDCLAEQLQFLKKQGIGGILSLTTFALDKKKVDKAGCGGLRAHASARFTCVRLWMWKVAVNGAEWRVGTGLEGLGGGGGGFTGVGIAYDGGGWWGLA